MFNQILTRLFGSRNERLLKGYEKIKLQINALEPKMQQLGDAELQAKTPEFKARIENGETLALLPEAFAVMREAAKRVLGMRHYDVQLVGGMVLHQGKIAEMRTGEGKTLVGTLPVYLNALAGKGVHVVTVNDYLAKRDSAWMGRVYNFLGMSGRVSCLSGHEPCRQARRLCCRHHLRHQQRIRLRLPARQHGAGRLEDRYQRGQFFAIVDEVDSILIDEARTPLIISGPADESPQLYIASIPWCRSSSARRPKRAKATSGSTKSSAGAPVGSGHGAREALLRAMPASSVPRTRACTTRTTSWSCTT
jgi:preprotein translocase subunit SecA